jgi:hypothetical protein
MALMAATQLGAACSTGQDQSAGLKLSVIDGRTMVDCVFVNGHGPYRFLLDTGSNVNLIESGLARKIGMSATSNIEFASAAGKSMMQGSDGNEITLGPAEADDQKFLFTRLEAVQKLDPDVRGVLGQWFLGRFDYLIDLRAKRLEFGKQERNGTRAGFQWINARTIVTTSLGGLALDSGAARLVLFNVEADGDPRGMVNTFTGSKAVGAASRKLVIEVRNVWHGDAVTMPSQTEPGVAGLLPVSLFKAVYVCNSDGYVVFEKVRQVLGRKPGANACPAERAALCRFCRGGVRRQGRRGSRE